MTASVDSPGRPARRPAAVTVAALVLVVLAAVQILVAALFVLNQAELTGSITRLYPSATAAELDNRMAAATTEGILVHVMLAVVYLASAWTLRLPARAVRIFVTALAVVATFTDSLILGQLPALLPSQAMLTYAVLATSTLLRLIVIALLWFGAPAQGWYARPAVDDLRPARRR